ncbi:L,D-transpeptidase [Paracoccaceae bacterium Fryx2]|nr:L,D-transpeptidase [Paracoccaceae bacterium Fryx2]
MNIFVAAGIAAMLGGCVPDPALVEAGLVQPPPPQTFTDPYVATKDGSFTVPAVPVEKVPPQFQRQTIYFPTEEAPGTVIINPGQRVLHLVTGPNQAIRYGISVGRAGFEWSGEALITDRKHWPTWTPPKEMIERDPKLAKWEKGQPGGPTNPLGARALYLTTNGVDYGYRIHGTPDWQSIGRSASSGCIRMINQDVMDLYQRVPNGAKVVVLNADGTAPSGLKLPPPAPKKVAKAPAPVVTPAAAPVETPALPEAAPAAAPATTPPNGMPLFVPAPLPLVPPALQL